MEDESKIPQEAKAPAEEPVKSAWQQKKESWYDKLPLTLKQMDIIVAVCWGLLILTVICIALESMGLISLFR